MLRRLLASALLIAITDAQMIRQCTCKEMMPCSHVSADVFLKCANACQVIIIFHLRKPLPLLLKPIHYVTRNVKVILVNTLEPFERRRTSGNYCLFLEAKFLVMKAQNFSIKFLRHEQTKITIQLMQTHLNITVDINYTTNCSKFSASHGRHRFIIPSASTVFR